MGRKLTSLVAILRRRVCSILVIQDVCINIFRRTSEINQQISLTS